MFDKDEKDLNKALHIGTDDVTELKDMVWRNIQNEINKIEGEGEVVKMRSKKNKTKSYFKKYGSIAAALLIVVLAGTQYGNASVDNIKKLFQPNKTIEQSIEGNQEKSNMQLKHSPANYIIYFDKDLYTMQTIDDKDVITPKKQAENLPEVFMEIEQAVDKKQDVVASEIISSLEKEYKVVKNKGNVKEPIESILISARSGDKWNDTVVNYYLIDNTKGGTFIVKQQYFMEASEGHGARFSHMLGEFKIINQ